MRLIDADRLRKELGVYKYGQRQLRTSITKLNIAIERSKVDAVEVVRCAECKGLRKYEMILNGEPYIALYWCDCVYPNFQIPTDQVEKHFCSYGERSERWSE